MNEEIRLLRRRFERERLARKQAEKIAEEKSRELYIKSRELERLSITDPLTGLPNRRFFDMAAQKLLQLSTRNMRPFAALMVDIDYFKRVNDTYGHAVGDRVLVAVAQACQQSIRGADLGARYGGEEFCFLLSETGTKGAHILTERLRTAIAALKFESSGQSFSVTVSIGISEYFDNKDSLKSLLQRSDEALYEAKRAGRNCVVIWTPFTESNRARAFRNPIERG